MLMLDEHCLFACMQVIESHEASTSRHGETTRPGPPIRIVERPGPTIPVTVNPGGSQCDASSTLDATPGRRRKSRIRCGIPHFGGSNREIREGKMMPALSPDTQQGSARRETKKMNFCYSWNLNDRT
jgi:hypothetical protein